MKENLFLMLVGFLCIGSSPLGFKDMALAV